MDEAEMRAEMHTCGFCTHWHEYHKTCSITGDRKKHDAEPCEMYGLDQGMASEYIAFQAGGRA